MANIKFDFVPCESGVPVLDIADRVRHAVQTCWDVEDLDVIYLAPNLTECDQWHSVLQSLGLTVFKGAEGFVSSAQSRGPLVMISATDWRANSGGASLQRVLHRFPDATICVISGYFAQKTPSLGTEYPEYYDGRALLQAAGIGFLSVESEHHA